MIVSRNLFFILGHPNLFKLNFFDNFDNSTLFHTALT